MTGLGPEWTELRVTAISRLSQKESAQVVLHKLCGKMQEEVGDLGNEDDKPVEKAEIESVTSLDGSQVCVRPAFRAGR